jgi:hypothetical protein
MKKQGKKLVLAKETLRVLESSDLDRVVGGVTEDCNSGDIGCELLKILRALSTSC